MRRAVFTAVFVCLGFLVAGAAHAVTIVDNSGNFKQGTLPTGSQCASWVLSDGWDPRPENAWANGWSAVPSAQELASFHTAPMNFPDGPPASDFATVDGNFAGTTWQLIEWASCKWGVNEYDLAAQAWLESSWIQTTLGDQQWTQAACMGAAWNGWQPWGGCWTSRGITQAKLASFNVWPEAATSTAFNLDFRGAYWRACMDGDIGYLYDETPQPGYSSYGNADGYDRYWGCAGEWGSGGWEDSYSTYYQGIMQGFSATRPWQQVPNSSVGQIAITYPQRGQTVSGGMTISWVMPSASLDPMACYACVSVDRQRIAACGSNTWAWWDSTIAGVNGTHEIDVDTYSCPSNGQDQQGWHAGIYVNVAN